MDEQWGYVGAKSRQRWLFYAYDRLRKTVVAHVFGERTMATLGRLMSLLSPFDVVIWMTDGWPLYESRLKGKLHVISKRKWANSAVLALSEHKTLSISWSHYLVRVVTIFATELVAIFNQAGKLSQYIESGSRRV